MLHAFDTGANLVLVHVEIDDRSKEIPAAQQLARRTRSGPACRHRRCRPLPKKTGPAANAAQAQLIVQLKDNQPSLLQQAKAASASGPPLMTGTSVTRGRNRRETRTFAVFEPVWDAGQQDGQLLVKQIIQVKRNVLQRSAKTGLWSSTAEVAFYLTNVQLTAPDSSPFAITGT